jgi:hypothetical protein
LVVQNTRFLVGKQRKAAARNAAANHSKKSVLTTPTPL